MQVLTVVGVLLAGYIAILLMDRGLDNLLEQTGLTLIEWAQRRRARIANIQSAIADRAEKVYSPLSDQQFSKMMYAGEIPARPEFSNPANISTRMEADVDTEDN